MFKKFLAHEPIETLAGKQWVTFRGQISPNRPSDNGRSA
ncbi:hypothetical protein J2S67_000139 [Pseudoglutamicibacter albus]|uniref:Uncharacterized protein n=1 Tax=Pseudoglutamicibacter albus TaxID=98671 RepID=A0ABU1YWZ7_9MICC|nr:hypothetical protein [Pseudoglutamicibacter albus]